MFEPFALLSILSSEEEGGIQVFDLKEEELAGLILILLSLFESSAKLMLTFATAFIRLVSAAIRSKL